MKEICLQCDFTEDQASRVASLIAKEDLKKGEGNGDPEVQVLEDCACLVFLVSDRQVARCQVMQCRKKAFERGVVNTNVKSCLDLDAGYANSVLFLGRPIR